METAIRHLFILRMVPRRGRIDAATIKNRLETELPGYQVSLRTIQRDLHTLMDGQFKLEFDGRKPQGWKWQDGAEIIEIPGMDLTAALTFRMAEEHLSRLLPKTCLSSLSPHFKQARKLLDQNEIASLNDWPQKVKVVPRTQPLLPPVIDPQVVDVVYRALFENLRFQVHYQRPGEEGKLLEINPLGIVFNDPAVYLVATCWNYTDLRLFALHRMSNADLLETPCTHPEGFDLQSYIDSGAFGFARQCGKTLHLKVLFEDWAARYLEETPLAEGQKVTERRDGRVLVEAEVADTEQLRWWLLGFGAAVEVVGPKWLREEFGEMSRKMAVRYGKEGEFKG